MSCCNYSEHLQVLNGFLAKADSKDKLTALIQFACLMVSAGEPGNLKKIQGSVAAARKVFRVMRPLEVLVPLLSQPGFTGKQPFLLEAINKVKTLCMALYFAGDHVVWAHQIGLISDKAVGDRYQKLSLVGWALGSCLTAIGEGWQISALQVKRKEGESDEEYNKRIEEIKKQINQRLFVLTHAVIQAVLAMGMLGTIKMKPRTTGLLGVIASVMNCYLLYPAYPKAKAQ